MLNFNRKQVELVVWICLVYLSWGLTDSIQAPFYPIEAESKGATAAEYGVVFGIIHLAMFLSGPLFGRYMQKLGVVRVFVFGVLGTAVCGCLFGFLTYLPDTASFLGLSYTLRVFEGVTEAGAWASVLTILSLEFKEHVTYVYSLTQASFGFAEILGPSVGGVMFEYSGFSLPFEFSGILCLIIGIIVIIRLPYITSMDFTVQTESKSSYSDMIRLLRNKGVLLALLGTVFGAVCQGFIETFLEEYLAIFELSVSQIGISFLAMSIPYMVATPGWGYLVDHTVQPEYISPIGSLLIIISLFLVGPVRYLHLRPDFLLTEVGLGLLGLGTAATLTATFALAQKHALIVLGDSSSGGGGEEEVNDDEASSIISGLWTSAFALGNFIGPTAGGPLVDRLGFAGTTPLLQGWAAVMFCLELGTLFWCRSTMLYARKKSDKVVLYTRLE